MNMFKSLVNQIVASGPVVMKVTLASIQIEKCLKDLDGDVPFKRKFVEVLQMFVDGKISVDALTTIVDAVDGVDLNRSQLQYLCDRVFANEEIVDIIHAYIQRWRLNSHEINNVAEFLVHEMNSAVVYA